MLVAVATGATVMSSHKTPQIFSRRSEERPVGTFAQHRKQGPQGVLHIPGKPRSAPGRGPGLAGDVEDALRALLPMLRERSDRTFLRPPAENLRRLVRRHDRRARGDGHEQSETPLRTGLTGAARLLFRRGGFVRPVGVENSVEMVCFVLEDYGRESVDRLRFFGEPLVAVAQYDPLRPHHRAR